MCLGKILAYIQGRIDCMFNDCTGEIPVFYGDMDDEYHYTNQVSSVAEQDRYMQERYYNEDMIE